MRKIQPVSKDKNARFSNVLELQKQSSSLCANSRMVYIVIFLIITIIAAAAEFYHEGTLRPVFLFGILPVFLIMPVISFVQYVPLLRLVLHMGRIRYSNAREVQIRCTKVRFMYRPIHRGLWFITWIVLTDEQGETYYYAFPKDSEPLHHEKTLFSNPREKSDPVNLIRQHLEGGSLTLLCYRDTHFIQSLDLPKGVSHAAIFFR